MMQLFAVKQLAAGANEPHIQETASKLNVFVKNLALQNISDITQGKVEKWIADERIAAYRAPRTINSYVIALKSFCNYLVETGRFLKSPLISIKKLNENIGRRKQRRAFTAEELQKIYKVARKNQTKKKPAKEDDRELIYRLLAGTGLRSTELGLAVPSQFDFERNLFTVDASKTKNKKADILPVRADLMKRLKKYIAARDIKPTERIFYYSAYSLLSALKRDLASAGIEQKSADGRSLDVHSFRRTFGTMLARAGVPLTTTQRLMRHSSPELTAKLYIDVEPLDMQNAVEKLTEI
ncbi:hypothetical protein FACS18942_02580 [Planctomycetales bacterium]|nr:hypothetical protein FACS18942_02580 [Planctomycetales bacterium]